MQPTCTLAQEQSSLLSQQLAAHAQEIGSIRRSLWQFKGLLVSYQNHRIAEAKSNEQNSLDDHNKNVKDFYQQIIKECDKACEALTNRDLQLLSHHTQLAQRFYDLLNAETHHFKNLVAKRFPRSKM